MASGLGEGWTWRRMRNGSQRSTPSETTMPDLPDDVRQADIDGEHDGCPKCREEFDRLGRCDCDYGSPCGRAGDMWQREETTT